MLTHDVIEIKRLAIQRQLDAAKSLRERNKLGQFATPSELANDMLQFAQSLLPPDTAIRFLDPAIGTGSFLSALFRAFQASRIASTTGYEIDPLYGHQAIELWKENRVQLHIADFTRLNPPIDERQKANLLICNPPYVRHHHLSGDEKQRLQYLAEKTTGVRLNELAGLYCYFLCIAHGWMAENGLAGWLIPSEFMDVNYGQQVKRYLLNNVTLLRIHRFDPKDVQFKDALVSSVVVWFKKAIPQKDPLVIFTYGGTLTRPALIESVPASELAKIPKWTKLPISTSHTRVTSPTDSLPVRLSDLFDVKRGLVTGANEFFMLSPEQIEKYQIPHEFLVPILPGPRILKLDEIEADSAGNPLLEQQLFLLNCNLSEEEVKKYPGLSSYLQTGVEMGIHKGYICSHRSPWYSQEYRSPSPFVCTYMGRQRAGSNTPFRFILNHSRAIVPNVYLLLYPKPPLERVLKNTPALSRSIWQALNSIAPETLISEGRVYGGGLHKLEPKELAHVPAKSVLAALPEEFRFTIEQRALF